VNVAPFFHSFGAAPILFFPSRAVHISGMIFAFEYID